MQSLFSILFSIAIVSCGQAQGSTPIQPVDLTPTATKITTVFQHMPAPQQTKKHTLTQKKKPANQNVPTKPKTTTSTQTKSTPAQTDQILTVEREVARLVNVERQKRGLKPLTLDTNISKIARLKSQDMRDKHYFDHQSPTYGSPFDMLNHFKVPFRTAGENIAAGQRTAAEVMNGWMNSQGHRENILNPNYTHIGVGYVKGGSYGTYWTQLFTG